MHHPQPQPQPNPANGYPTTSNGPFVDFATSPNPPQHYQQAQLQANAGYAPSQNPNYVQQVPMPRFLHIYEDGLTHRHRQILDTDKRTVLYTVKANSGALFSSKPHVTITSATTGVTVGTITFHQISNKVDLTVRDQPISLHKSSIFGSRHEFMSLATGSQLKWKRDGVLGGMVGDMLCLDQNEQQLARYDCSTFALMKEGKVELAPGVDGPLMDELLVSGIAMLEYKRREDEKNSTAG